MSDEPARELVEELESVTATCVLRERRSDGTLGPSIPLAAIDSLTLVALFAESLPDTDAGIVNDRKAVALITATVVHAVPATGMTCAYAKDTADVSTTDPTGTWKLTLGFAPEDMAILDERCPEEFEQHTALFECRHTGGVFHPRLLFSVRNLRRVG